MRTRICLVACLLVFSACAPSRLSVGVGNMILFSESEVPLEFTGYDGRYPVVSVEIAGGTYRLMLDTGSSGEAIALTRETLSKLDVSFTGRRRIYRDAYGGMYESREFVIPSVRLGKFEVRNVWGNERHEAVYDLDGAIGLDLLRSFDVLIDYSSRRLTLYRRDRDPSFLDDDEWSACSYTGNLCVSVAVDSLDRRYWFGLDTGCGCNLVAQDSDLGQAVARALGRSGDRVRLGRRKARQSSSYHVEHLYLGRSDLGLTRLVLWPLPSYLNDGLIGYDFFARHLVYITFRRRQLWFKPVTDDRAPQAVSSVQGLSHTSEPGKTSAMRLEQRP